MAVEHPALTHYLAGRWADASLALSDHPSSSVGPLGPLIAAHCRAETAELESLPSDPVVFDGIKERTALDPVARVMKNRIAELCEAREFSRAARVSEILAAWDGPVGQMRAQILGEPSPHRPLPGSFRDHLYVDGDALERCQSALGGLKVLMVLQAADIDTTKDYHIFTNLMVTGEQFGLSIGKMSAPRGMMDDSYVPYFATVLEQIRPDVVIFDNLYELGLPTHLAGLPGVAGAVAEVLATARARQGLKVVNLFYDLWMAQDRDITRGLGYAVDLIHDMHPGSSAEDFQLGDDHRFCYPMPYRMPEPTVVPGSIPRIAFTGNITWFNVGRALWWAEIGKRGLPVDRFAVDYTSEATLRPYSAYVDLLAGHRASLNFTARDTGRPIITGRSIETPMVGGCLLEEHCPDTAWFMTEGEHFLSFSSIDELEALVSDALADPARCAEIGRAGQAHVSHFFSGRHFWAGLLSRLW